MCHSLTVVGGRGRGGQQPKTSSPTAVGNAVPSSVLRIIQLPCSSLLTNSNPPRSDFHKRCACHAKLSSANHPLTEGETHGLRKNMQNFIKVHFRLLTANPKAEALYLITETAKKKENIVQNI